MFTAETELEQEKGAGQGWTLLKQTTRDQAPHSEAQGQQEPRAAWEEEDRPRHV